LLGKKKDYLFSLLGKDVLIPTLNGYGYMLEKPDFLSKEFIKFSSENSPVLDIGCAYGNVAIQCLKKGGIVYAVDLLEEHIFLLRSLAPVNLLKNLFTFAGRFPDIPSVEPNFFSGILASGVLHYLRPDDLLPAFKRVFDLLKPGGKFFFMTSTPYIKLFESFYPEYLKRLEKGDPYPGYIIDPGQYAPERRENLPETLILMNKDNVRFLLKESGFKIEFLEFVKMPDCPEYFQNEGKEYIGAIGVK
jgi:SAM-dependent methyltransferase